VPAAPFTTAPQANFAPAVEYNFPEPLHPVLPDDAAVSSSPFIDASISLVSLEDRFIDPLVFGIAFGGYFGKVVRVVARLEMPSSDSGDEEFYASDTAPGYVARTRDTVTLIYGGSLGFVAAYSPSFVFSPGLTFLRTDVADHGNMFGVAIPFEWTTSRGLRFGLEVGFGRAFGGKQHFECQYTAACTQGAQLTTDRDAGRALTLRFGLGFGFNHPKATRRGSGK
jgi:hypothetical protein